MSTTGPMTWTTLPTFCAAATAVAMSLVSPSLTATSRSIPPSADRLALTTRSYSACAPDTTSMISRVIAAWRTLFMYSVRLLDHVAPSCASPRPSPSSARRRTRRSTRAARGTPAPRRGAAAGARTAPPAPARTGSRPAACRPALGAAVDVEPRDRQQLLDDDPLRHHRLELVVDEIDAVDLRPSMNASIAALRDRLRVGRTAAPANRLTCS